jgi:hypothetical protein
MTDGLRYRPASGSISTMALRIHESVVRGEIDNRRRGRVEGWITLVGVERPVTLELTGNCLRDLAGCVVRFENPRPLAMEDEKNMPAPLQHGVAGEITASRKVRVLDVALEEATRLTRSGTPPPEHSANVLYLEWFSEANGRVVVESSDYQIEVSAAGENSRVNAAISRQMVLIRSRL